MAAVANNPSFAKKAGVPTSVGKDFLNADKGRKFKEGGDMKESKAMAAKEMAFMKKKGAPKSMIKHEMAEAGMKKMSGGGYTGSGGRGVVEMPGDKTLNSPKRYATKILPSSMSPLTKSEDKAKGGPIKGVATSLKAHAAMPASKAHAGMKSGGYVKAADGVATKGKTKAKQITMKNGGMC